MEKWNHANKTLLCLILKKHLLLSTTKEDHYRACPLQSQNIKGQQTVSRQYRCAACHPLQFFPKNNLRIQKARVGVFLWVQLISLGYFLLCPAINRETKFAFTIYNKSFGDFIGTIFGKQRKKNLINFELFMQHDH